MEKSTARGRSDFKGLGWDRAIYKGVSLGNALVLPVEYAENVTVSKDGSNFQASLKYSFAYGYKEAGEIKLKVVQAIPTDNHPSFTGNLLVSSLNGAVERILIYEKGEFVEEQILPTEGGRGRTNGKTCTVYTYWWCTEQEGPDDCDPLFEYEVCTFTLSHEPSLTNELVGPDENGGGDSVSEETQLCPNPLMPDMMVPCNEVTCGEDYFLNEDGDCVEIQIPCEIAELLEDDGVLRQKLAELKAETDLNKEVGFYVKDGVYNSISGNPNVHGIEFTVNGTIQGLIHTHFDGGYPIFSPTDVQALYFLMASGNINPFDFYSAIVTSSGTQWMMMIDDIDKFKNFSEANFSLGNSEFNLLNVNMIVAEKMGTHEVSMLKALSDSGLKLFKGNNSFTKWKAKTESNGYTVNDNCN